MKKFLKLIPRGVISLFCLALACTVLAGATAMVCGGDKVTVITVAAIAGALATMGVGDLAALVGMQLTKTPHAGILGSITGVIIMLLAA